jgi:hypothetical protein
MSKCFPLFTPLEDNSWALPLRAVDCPLLSLQTCGECGFKLFLWRFTFLNYTRSTKYEALETNGFASRQIAWPSILEYSLVSRKAQLY